MRELRTLTASELEEAYSTVFSEAFPPQELKPLSAMQRMWELGEYEPCGLFENGSPIGYICLWKNGRYILIDYLCVPRDIRSGGIGGETVKKAISAAPGDTIFIGEVEAPTGDPERDGIINRRLGFYARLGAQTAGYDTALFGVHYKTIYWSSSPVDEAELLEKHRGLYLRHIPDEIYQRAIKIPLAPGEAPESFDQWRE